MKIGIFTDSYKPYTSGVVVSISTFKEELTRLGHDVYIFAPNYPHYHEEEERVYRYYSLPAPTNPDYTLALPVFPGMNILIKKLKLDIIHVHTPFIMGRVGMHYARKLHIPMLFTYHTRYDQYVHYVPVAQDLARDITIKYSSAFCNQCSHVIVPSQEIKEIVQQNDVTTPISVIPTGVPLDRFSSGDSAWLRNNYAIPEKNKVLLFVGRLTQEKNIPFLIRAFGQVHDQRQDTTLVITAQGPMESELKALARKLGLNENKDIVFTGALPYESLVNVYHSADLFVFSSLTETQGLVLLEAMAAGLPVVAVQASGVREMIENGVNGILTSCDTSEMAAAICEVLNNPQLYKRLQANALQKAFDLSSHNMALNLESIYTSLLENRDSYKPRRTLDVSSWLSI